jgi:hypothetical protein
LAAGGGSIPLERGVFGYSTHTANTVFWVATRTIDGESVDTSSVYTAKL